ncbi:MAG: Hpt domain-containing protein [Bacteroidales bacterium]|nr:Hpt domain-containing protein [Bacteroidales bacterium]
MNENPAKFDLAFLNKISGGDQEFIKEMIKTFKEMVPEFIENSRKYLNEGQYESLSREAHKFIPGVSFLGIKYLENDLSLIEDYSKKQKNTDELPALVDSAIEKVLEIVGIFDKEFK